MVYNTATLTQADSAYPPLLITRLGSRAPAALTILGDYSILQRPLLGFFCSIACPGDVILQIYDLAIALREAQVPVISGYASPMEQEIERFMMRGKQPLIRCLARHPNTMQIPQDWQERLSNGQLVIVSPFQPTTRRVSISTALTRNMCAAALSSSVLIAHAEHGGETERLAQHMQQWDIHRYTLASREHADYINLGLENASPTDIQSWWKNAQSRDATPDHMRRL